MKDYYQLFADSRYCKLREQFLAEKYAIDPEGGLDIEVNGVSLKKKRLEALYDKNQVRKEERATASLHGIVRVGKKATALSLDVIF